MKILGIDPGYGLCGFALIEKEKSKLTLATCGVFRTKPKTNFADRLCEIADDFASLLKKYKPDVVSIEDLFFVKNVTTGLQVAQVRGILVLLSQKAGARVVEPKPVEVKSCFTGSGKATKCDMKKMAKMIFKLKSAIHVDDAADAIAVAYWAAQDSSKRDREIER